MKIYTITCSRAYNYGAVLQTYALKEYLVSINNDVFVIDYKPPYLRKIQEKYRKNYVLRAIRRIIYFPDYFKSKKIFNEFLEGNIHTTSLCESLEDIEKLDKADIYIAGSDQIWNPILENGRDDSYFLNFSFPVRKIAYAASIGVNYLPEAQKRRYKNLLADFELITVRERTAVEILSHLGISAYGVMDPVFFLSSEDWEKLEINMYLKDSYVLVYALHHIQEIYNYAKQLADELNCKVYIISVEYKEKRRGNDKFFWNPKVGQYLKLIHNAEAVVTNSFHGIAFSIIYNKPIHIFDTEKNDTRISDLVECLSLEKRVIDQNYKDIITNDFSYKNINKNLNSLIKESKDLLLSILK